MIDDEQQLHNDIANALEAEKLLGNALLQSIIFSHKNDACQQFMNTNRCDDKQRLDAWQSAQGFIAFEASLQQLIESGKMAQSIIEERKQHKAINNNPLG